MKSNWCSVRFITENQERLAAILFLFVQFLLLFVLSSSLHCVTFLLPLQGTLFPFSEPSSSMISQNRCLRILGVLAQVCCILYHFIPALTISWDPFLFFIFFEQPSYYLTFFSSLGLTHWKIYLSMQKKCILVVVFRKPDVRNVFGRYRPIYF